MPRAVLCFCVAACLLFSASPRAASAQARRVELRFTPTARAQLALWIESEDGSIFETVRLTQAVSFRGIGNRPGALQMNSGFLWPFGRREGALPVWAHRRVASGQSAFPRVIFNGRVSEGNASSAGSVGEPRNTRDDYFCLSFNRELSGRDNLDAVSCASTFSSNKGRYLTEDDRAMGYAEPFEEGGGPMMRSLATQSLYPPRRDVPVCTAPTCVDHENVGTYAPDARAAMPEIDAVTMATPEGDLAQTIVFDVPETWADGAYVAYIEINVEGDYNEAFNETTFPTPIGPTGAWDFWAMNYGYAYRGQPAMVYRVPFTIGPAGGTFRDTGPVGYGALHGEDGDIRAIDASISDDPSGAPGSGADRLRSIGGERFRVTVPLWDVCAQTVPPVECGRECTPTEAGTCGADLLCGPEFTCVGICDVPMMPERIAGFTVQIHPDEKEAHRYARLRFEIPASPRGIARYEVRYSTSPIVDDESFMRGLPAVQASIDTVELTVPTTGAVGEVVELDFGGLSPETTYYIAIRAADDCNALSAFSVAEVRTTGIFFTTVSPCFIATAAYGSPMAERVATLRRFRDRHLMTNAPGRAFVDAYYAIGPSFAHMVRHDERRRAVARAALTPLVWLAEQLD